MKITKKQLKQIIKEELGRVIAEDAFDDYWDSVDNRYHLTRDGAEKENYREKYNKGWRFVSDEANHAWLPPGEVPRYSDSDEPYGGDVDRRDAAYIRKRYGDW
jgi:hypothetical protein